MRNNNETSRIPFRDRIIPWYFVMVFLLVFAINGVFAYVAITTNKGVVTDNAYEKGLDYNHIVQEVRKLKAQRHEEPKHSKSGISKK
ncbi:MAG: FixH family protein [Rickettsiales bacterium]